MSSSSVLKAKPIFSRPDGSSKGSSSSLPAKKFGSSSNQQIVDVKSKSVSRITKLEQIVDVKSKSVSRITKFEVKAYSSSKASSSSKVSAKAPTTPVKREKKVFSLAGQKFDPPEEREPLRIFYESLSEQIPSSEMAEFWLMEHGLLSPERAKRAHEKKQRKQKQLRMGTPMKSPPRSIKPESSFRQQQEAKNGEARFKKRMMNESDYDDEFILSPKRRKG